MKIVAAQWNVQGCEVLKEGVDPKLGSSYEGDNPQYFADILKEYKPDIVTLQEIHSNEARDQATEIAEVLGLEHVRTDAYEKPSFMDKSYGLGQSIISRFAFNDSSYDRIGYERFEFPSPHNPREVWKSRQNGITRVVVEVNGQKLTIATTHLIPFGWLNLDPWAREGPAAQVRSNLQGAIGNFSTPWLMQGDMNVHTDRFSRFLGKVADRKNFDEVEQTTATNPYGRMLDHVVVNGPKIVSNKVDTTVRADHYLLVTELEI